MNQDIEIYISFLSGDIQAFEELVLKYKDNLIFFIQRYISDIYIAEDISQEVFAYIYINKEKYNLKCIFKTYIFTLARNKAIDYFRKNSRLSSLVNYDIVSEDERSLEEKVIADQEKRVLLDAVKQLKRDYQSAIYLVDFEELSYHDAAKIMNKSISQMKILIHRARQALKKTILKGE